MASRPESITVEEAHRRMKAQGVSSNKHVAFVCPVCGTVQSMASLVAAGCPKDKVESYIGFSCEGRWTGAGPWPSGGDRSAKGLRRTYPGCDWTLGGLFRIHRLEVVMPDRAEPQPCFEIASPEQAQALEAQLRPPKGKKLPSQEEA